MVAIDGGVGGASFVWGKERVLMGVDYGKKNVQDVWWKRTSSVCELPWKWLWSLQAERHQDVLELLWVG